MTLPKPQTYGNDWKSWASKLIAHLGSAVEVTPIQLPIFTKDRLPAATSDGLLIFVSDDTGGPTVAVSFGNNWNRVSDNAVIS